MKNKKLLIAVIALVLVVAALAAVYFTSRPTTQEGSTAFTVTVIHADGSEKKFEYRTDETSLGTFLEEKGLIDSKGADQGMFHSVDGEKAVYSEDGAYWAVYEGEEYALQGIDTTPVKEGQVYKLVWTAA